MGALSVHLTNLVSASINCFCGFPSINFAFVVVTNSRSNTLRMSHWFAASSPFSSRHVTGTETPSPGRARAENAAIVVAPFLAILVTLIVRPQGLLGGKVQVKKV